MQMKRMLRIGFFFLLYFCFWLERATFEYLSRNRTCRDRNPCTNLLEELAQQLPHHSWDLREREFSFAANLIALCFSSAFLSLFLSLSLSLSLFFSPSVSLVFSSNYEKFIVHLTNHVQTLSHSLSLSLSSSPSTFPSAHLPLCSTVVRLDQHALWFAL